MSSPASRIAVIAWTPAGSGTAALSAVRSASRSRALSPSGAAPVLPALLSVIGIDISRCLRAERAAKQALGPQHQDQDHHDQRIGVGPFGIAVTGAEAVDEAEHQAADDGLS